MSSGEINRSVWKRVYGVTDAQWNDPDWLARDDDGDGVKNGDEIAAGTDPTSAGSSIQVKRLTVDASGVHLSFDTQKGKQYVLQKTQSLVQSGSWQPVSPAVSVMGSDKEKTLTTAQAADTFYRVLVQDVDTDGDGTTDWAEYNLGLDPLNAHSNVEVDSYGRPLTDGEYASQQLNLENVVTVSTAPGEASAEQPDAGATASNPPAFTVARAGLRGFLKVLLVNVSIGGTAVAGTDYTPLSTQVTIPAGIRSVRVQVIPLANAARIAPATVTMSLQAGTGYTRGQGTTTAVQLYPHSTPTGTGLTGAYYSDANATYGSATNFSGTATTQVDATIDFKWSNVATPAAGFVKPPGVPLTPAGYNVRWTGQVQPQYSERYWFVVKADDYAVLKINPVNINNLTSGAGVGQIILNTWTGGTRTGASDQVATPIDLKAGVRYNIQLDYFSTAAAGETHLSWYSNSQVKQIIPTARLYPALAGAAAAPPVLTSESTLYGYLGQPFSSTLVASNSPTGFALQTGTLPPGVTLSTGGLLSGTPTAAGEYPLTARITNAAGFSDTALTISILDTGGGLTREVWKGLPAGTSVSAIPLDTTPTITSTVPTFEDVDKTYGSNYGVRLRGYITVNTTGNYYFWLSANKDAELWISNNSDRVSRVLRATTKNGGATSRFWARLPQQKSGWLNLVAGRKYYVEVLHRATVGSENNVAVGWTLDPNGNGEAIANGTGVVPGHVLWKYYDVGSYASSTAAAGALYYTKLGPQGVAVSNGSGLATLRLSDDLSQAILKYNHTGLSSEVVAQHLHADAYLTKPAGPIIFDIDAATPQPDGSYIWNIVPVGVFTKADLQQIVLQGKCYLNIHTVNYPNGEVRGNFNLANGAQTFVPPPEPPALPTGTPTTAEASRFLTQATFGPNAADLTAVTADGYRKWLDQQFNQASTKHMPLVLKQANAGTPWPSTMTFNAWWNRSITAPDQLRQRMAFALSEILVISEIGPLDERADALSDYYDLLLDNAFGNFRDVLEQVTLHPAMGVYLDMRGNNKGDLATGLHANENYAREIMQLFSIGLNRLWPDGSVVLDSNFGLVPTYDQDVITGLAQVFTGWTYAQARQGSGRLPTGFGPASNFVDQMMLVPRNHDLNEKRILDNVILPAPPTNALAEGTTDTDPNFHYINGQGAATEENAFDANGLRDLKAVTDALFNHPNVGPLICRQLIQRLVTSNPTPAYLYRVVRAFNGERNVDGVATGVRGDLKEVLRAILLDYEARSSASLTDNIFGKQREPVLRVTAPARYLAAKGAITATYSQNSTVAANLGRIVLTLPTGTTLPLATTDSLNLQFNLPTDNTTVPYSSNAASSSYAVRSTSISGVGASAVQTVTVDAVGQYRGTYAQSGTPVTIAASGHLLKVGGSVYLKFAAGAGGQADDGLYDVKTVPNANSFTVTSTKTLTISGSPLCVLHRLTNGGMSVSNTTVGTGASAVVTSNVTIFTTTPHRLVAGNAVTIFATGILDGSTTSIVATVPTPTSFTIQPISQPLTAPLASQGTGGITIFPQIAMEMDRSGTLSLSTSIWNLGQTDGESTSVSITQTPLRSPTVFNYFFPDYKNPGTIAAKGFTTPEFQLTSEANTMALTNFVANGFFNGTTAAYTDGRASFRDGNEAILMDLSTLMAFKATSGLPALVDKLNNEMMGGIMSADMRQAILDYAGNTAIFPAASTTQVRDQVRAVVHLIVTSAEYAIQK